ncbi:FliH/SctL family protein [Thalassomonas sp. RHCl1]|uniref:FliH/SctL family protein n=1 Tax=Thalassomonas sp. RHCl1 TaxID=2995320 RepID=UPI00248BF9D8|nr:FliH/SctL family protein [Thalassomonas sp. RHCl1]
MNTSRIVKSAGSGYRPHKFPPFRSESEELATLGDDEQPSFEQGFQEGLELGHKEGHQQGFPQGIEQGKKEGHQQGLASGLAEGQKKGQAIFHSATGLLATIQDKVEQLSHHKLQAQQTLIGDLVTQVARSVIRAELTLNPKQILTLAEEAMASLSDDVDKIRIFLNSEDLQRLSALGLTELNGWPLEADDQLDIGDCLIRSAQMEIAVNTEERFAECMENVNKSIA